MDDEELELKRQLRKAKADELARRKRQREDAEDLKNFKKPLPNCAIYVSNLPLKDLNKEEIIDEFTRFGIIRKDPITDQPRCKLYVDKDGIFKGDALIVYFRPESVEMAIELMNGATYKGQKLKVEEATFNEAAKKTETTLEEASEFKKMKVLKSKEQERELNDWSDTESRSEKSRDDESSSNRSTESMSDKVTRVVILTNVLDLYANLGPQEVAEIAADLKDGCQAVGEVVSLELDDVLGQAKVEYSTQELARECCQMMNGRYFDGRKLMAYTLDEESSDGLRDLLN
ncbi:LANO_0H01376g1_1 [Lachancea nothofagi CBS 11611]|uniref:LANO_0H01376g1_1 n=1 Tax=Lachancea nothofagi CBS 11611 TaxID=1266666 RepID=A0A1G4KKS0_9SACH|nr:LANO_0H01376g1_1 [Lachancea nothofagi CBS 11611]